MWGSGYHLKSVVWVRNVSEYLRCLQEIQQESTFLFEKAKPRKMHFTEICNCLLLKEWYILSLFCITRNWIEHNVKTAKKHVDAKALKEIRKVQFRWKFFADHFITWDFFAMLQWWQEINILLLHKPNWNRDILSQDETF